LLEIDIVLQIFAAAALTRRRILRARLVRSSARMNFCRDRSVYSIG